MKRYGIQFGLVVLAALLLARPVCAQVVGLQPEPLGMYTWNSSSGQYDMVTTTDTANPNPTTPEPIVLERYNTTLGQWVPCSTAASCFGTNAVTQLVAGSGISLSPTTGLGTVTVTNAGVTQIVAGRGISISPTGGTGAVTVNASAAPVTRNSQGECFLGIGGLVGAFTDGGGVVKQPLCLGDGPASVTTPAGATQLQLGIDDDMYAHTTPNQGSFSIDVSKNGGTATPVTVAGTAMPWDPSLSGNAAYPFSLDDGTSPVVAISGLSTGDVITVTYVSGTVSVGPPTFPYTDANGWLTSPPGAAGDGGATDSILSPSSTWWATKYMSATYTSGAITALTGDGSAAGPGSVPFTLATVNSAPGTCGDATHVCQVTTNGKGLTTAQTAVAISANAVTLQTNGVNNSSQSVLNLTGTGPIVATNTSGGTVQISCPTCSTGSGTSLSVNGGAALGTANLNGTTPAAGASNLNVTWQNSGSDISAQVPFGTNSAPGVVQCDGTTTTCTGGVISASGSGGSAVDILSTQKDAGSLIYYPALEYYAATSGVPVTIFSATGSGYISDITYADGNSTSYQSSVIACKVNGEATASFSGAIRTIFETAWLSAIFDGNYFTSFNGQSGQALSMPIPFSNGITCTLTPSANTTIWVDVTAHSTSSDAWPYTRKLHTSVVDSPTPATVNGVSYAPYTYETLANWYGPNPGRLVGIWLLNDGNANNNGNALEGNIAVYLDATTATWAASTSFSLNQVIMDPCGNFQKVTTAGTSGATEPACGTWGTVSGITTTDGSVTWTAEVGTPLNIWRASAAYVLGMSFLDPNGNVQTVTTAGTTSGTQPTYCATAGCTTTDGTVVTTTSLASTMVKAGIVSSGTEDFFNLGFYAANAVTNAQGTGGMSGVTVNSADRFGFYRFFVNDPIRFQHSLGVIRQIGDPSEAPYTGDTLQMATTYFYTQDTN